MQARLVTRYTAGGGGIATPALVAAPVAPLHHSDVPVDGVRRTGIHLSSERHVYTHP